MSSRLPFSTALEENEWFNWFFIVDFATSNTACGDNTLSQALPV